MPWPGLGWGSARRCRVLGDARVAVEVVPAVVQRWGPEEWGPKGARCLQECKSTLGPIPILRTPSLRTQSLEGEERHYT
eukprot:9377052-Pyramimonas_sp.AAC.1